MELFERTFVRPKPGRTLVIGSLICPGKSDRRKNYSGEVIGVDMREGEGVDKVVNMEERIRGLGVFTHIECLSVLEHSRRPWLIAKNIEKLLESKGSLYLSTPTVWRYHPYPKDYWRFTSDGIEELFGNFINFTGMKYTLEGDGENLYPIPKIPRPKNLRGFLKVEIYAFGYKK